MAAYRNLIKTLYTEANGPEPGKAKYEASAEVHKKDPTVQQKYGVCEGKGLEYCLSSLKNTNAILKTHAGAHGMLTAHIYQVTDKEEATLPRQKNLFMDVHFLGAGQITAVDVAAAHKKDLAVQQKYGVNFINYWVDEKDGTVICLSQAKDAASVIKTHKEAHGLVPAYVLKVKQGE